MINDRQAIYIHPPSDLSLLRFVTRERGRKLTLRVTWLGLIPETGNHNPSGSRNGILRGERNVNQLRVRRYALWPGKFCQASLIAASLDLRNFRRGQRGSSSSNSSSEGVPPPLSASSRYADLCHVIPPLSLPVPRVSCPSAIKFFLFETNNETFVQHRPTDGLPTKRNNRNETEENGLRRMDENSIPLFCLRSTKRNEPFLRRDGNWSQFPTTRWKDTRTSRKGYDLFLIKGESTFESVPRDWSTVRYCCRVCVADYKRCCW